MRVKFSVVSVCGGASGETSASVASTTFSASSEISSFSLGSRFGFSSASPADSCSSDSDDPESGPDVDSSDSDSLSDSDSDEDEKTGLLGFFVELVVLLLVAPRSGTSRTDVGGAIVGKSGKAYEVTQVKISDDNFYSFERLFDDI